MLGYLSANIICSKKRTVFLERTVSFEEQMMSKDKFLSIFSRQIDAVVFIILQIFFATRAVLKIGEYPRIFPSFSWGIFGHMKRLDQSCASENIWWITTTVRPTVHSNPSRATSFLGSFPWHGGGPTPKPEKRPWERRCVTRTEPSEDPSKPEKFENAGFPFWCGQKTFWKRSFSKTMASR